MHRYYELGWRPLYAAAGTDKHTLRAELVELDNEVSGSVEMMRQVELSWLSYWLSWLSLGVDLIEMDDEAEEGRSWWEKEDGRRREGEQESKGLEKKAKTTNQAPAPKKANLHLLSAAWKTKTCREERTIRLKNQTQKEEKTAKRRVCRFYRCKNKKRKHLKGLKNSKENT